MDVAALWRYPVKSLGGERLATAVIERRGLVGDRRWAVVDRDGKLGSGKSSRRFRAMDGLLHIAAATNGEDVVDVVGPFGRRRADDPDLAAELSALLGLDVHLAVEGTVAHHDDEPIHLVTTSGLRWLHAQLGTDETDEDLARRMRPNVVVAAAGDEPVEDRWPAGTVLTIGPEVRLRITKPTERCVMTTMTQPGLQKDPAVLRTLAQTREARFGAYAEVVHEGMMRLGDPVEVTTAS